MADTLTTSSRIAALGLRFSTYGFPTSVDVTDSDGDNHYGSGRSNRATNLSHFDPDNIEDDSVLGVLQAIWASDAGFLDGDGNAAPVTIEDTAPRNITVDELEAHGYLNPFDSGSYARFLAKQQMLGKLQTHGTLDTNDDTGVSTLGLGLGVQPEPVEVPPETTTVDIDLDDLAVTVFTDVLWRLRRTFPSPLPTTEAGILADPQVAALYEWLETIRVSGDPITATDPLPLDDVENREFEIENADDSWSLRFAVNLISYSQFAGAYTIWSMIFRRISGDALDSDQITDIVRAASVTTTVQDGMTYQPPWGNVEVDSAMREAHFPGNKQLVEHKDGLALETTGPHDHEYVLPVIGNHGVTIEHEDLAENSGSQKLVPTSDIVDTIHFGPESAADTDVRFPALADYVSSNGVHRATRFHNRNAGTRRYRVRDPNDNVLMSLYGGENVALQAIIHRNGDQELVAIDPPPRRDERLLSSSSPIHLDDAGFRSIRIDSTTYFLPMKYDAAEYSHEDAFETFSALPPVNQLFSNMTTWEIAGAVKMKLAGNLRWAEAWVFEAESDTGSIGGGHAIRLYRIRDGVVTQVADERHGELSGSGSFAFFRLNEVLVAEKDDIFLAGWRYPTSATLARANIRVHSVSRNLALENARIEMVAA